MSEVQFHKNDVMTDQLVDFINTLDYEEIAEEGYTDEMISMLESWKENIDPVIESLEYRKRSKLQQPCLSSAKYRMMKCKEDLPIELDDYKLTDVGGAVGDWAQYAIYIIPDELVTKAEEEGAEHVLGVMTAGDRLKAFSAVPDLINSIIKDLSEQAGEPTHTIMESKTEIPELAKHLIGYIDDYPDRPPFYGYFLPLELVDEAKKLGAVKCVQ